MRIAYFNCPSGIAGDMILASFIDAGLPKEKLEKKLKDALKIRDWSLESRAVRRGHFNATNIVVRGERHFKSPDEMLRIISSSRLPDSARASSVKIIKNLIRAEAKVHKIPERKVHFHELNSLDTLIDVAGSCLCFEFMEIDKAYSSEINIGCAAPATIELIKEKGMPVYSSNTPAELATPTGTAVILHFAERFGGMPGMSIERSGFGAGANDPKDRPNMLRLLIGKTAISEYGRDEVVLLETNIDDMDPRIYPYVMEKLFAAGAKDVWLAQVMMKKGRPGIVLSAICDTEKENEAIAIIFKETTTLGIRRRTCQRHILKRDEKHGLKTAHIARGKNKNKIRVRNLQKTSPEIRQTPLYLPYLTSLPKFPFNKLIHIHQNRVHWKILFRSEPKSFEQKMSRFYGAAWQSHVSRKNGSFYAKDRWRNRNKIFQ